MYISVTNITSLAVICFVFALKTISWNPVNLHIKLTQMYVVKFIIIIIIYDNVHYKLFWNINYMSGLIAKGYSFCVTEVVFCVCQRLFCVIRCWLLVRWSLFMFLYMRAVLKSTSDWLVKKKIIGYKLTYIVNYFFSYCCYSNSGNYCTMVPAYAIFCQRTMLPENPANCLLHLWTPHL